MRSESRHNIPFLLLALLVGVGLAVFGGELLSALGHVLDYVLDYVLVAVSEHPRTVGLVLLVASLLAATYLVGRGLREHTKGSLKGATGSPETAGTGSLSRLAEVWQRNKGDVQFYVPAALASVLLLWLGFTQVLALIPFAAGLVKAVCALLLAGAYDRLPWRKIDTLHELQRGNYAYALTLAARTLAVALCLALG